jgi:hypothetical protein
LFSNIFNSLMNYEECLCGPKIRFPKLHTRVRFPSPAPEFAAACIFPETRLNRSYNPEVLSTTLRVRRATGLTSAAAVDGAAWRTSSPAPRHVPQKHTSAIFVAGVQYGSPRSDERS